MRLTLTDSANCEFETEPPVCSLLRGMTFLRGWAAPSAPGPRRAIVLTPRRGNDKLAQGRASRLRRDAPPWVARPPQDPSPRRGTTRPITGCDHEQLRTGCEWMASIRWVRRAKQIGHVPRNVGIRIISTLGFSRLWRICDAFVSPLQGDGRAGLAVYPGRRSAAVPRRSALG
jgi:hypothetical protein